MASLLATLASTGAAAFDIGGLIGTAMAIQMGSHYRGPSYHHSREHVASRHDRSSDDDNATEERDARDVERPANVGSSGGSEKSHQPASVPHGITAQASERDATAGQVVLSDRTSGDAPAFTPSR